MSRVLITVVHNYEVKSGLLQFARVLLHYGLQSIHVIFMIPSSRYANVFIPFHLCQRFDNKYSQILAGEEIRSSVSFLFGPNKDQRACNVARDPYAAAQFFHYLIQTTMEKLFGVTTSTSSISSNMGVAGKLSAYFGTMESQGCGSLHLHLLLFLEGSPSPQRIQELLQESTFCDKVTHFLHSTIYAEIPGLHTKEDLHHIPNNVEIAWSRPPDPSLPDDIYNQQLENFEFQVARAKQIHTCSHRQCLTVNNKGHYQCK